MASWSAEEKERIRKLIDTAKITKDSDTLAWYKKSPIKKMVAAKERYKRVADIVGCPVALVAIFHCRENASDLGKFDSYLGNGQPLDKKTTIVPKGRGPFASWEEGAVDALRYDGIDKVDEWSEERMLYEAEKYNGFGYRPKGVQSPYVWSGSSHYNGGLFYADHKFSYEKKDGNLGAFVLYSLLVQADSEFLLGSKYHMPPKEKEEEEHPDDVKAQGIVDAIMSLLQALLSLFTGKRPPKEEDSVGKATPLEETRNLKALKMAGSQVGVKEVSGSGDNPQVRKYHAYSTKDNKVESPDSVAWCASFVCWVLEMVGMGSTNSKMARSYESWGIAVRPQDVLPGDIAVYWRGSKSSGSGHVGFVVKHISKGDYILGGNQSDSVNVAYKSNDRLLSYRRSSKAGDYSEAQIKEIQDLADRLMKGEIVDGGSEA